MMAEEEKKKPRWSTRDIITGVACGVGVMMIVIGLNDMYGWNLSGSTTTLLGILIGGALAYALVNLRKR